MAATERFDSVLFTHCCNFIEAEKFFLSGKLNINDWIENYQYMIVGKLFFNAHTILSMAKNLVEF